MADHGHVAGQTCNWPGCGDPGVGAAAAVDRVMRTLPVGKAIPRTYVYECVAHDLDDRPDRRGSVSRANRQAQFKSVASRGSRLTQKCRLRILRLAEAGAIDLIGHHMITVVDMDTVPSLEETR